LVDNIKGWCGSGIAQQYLKNSQEGNKGLRDI